MRSLQPPDIQEGLQVLMHTILVCPGIDQCGNVAEGEQGAFLCSKVLTEGLLCKARPKSPVCILRDLGSGSLWLHLIHLPGVLSARPPSLLTP